MWRGKCLLFLLFPALLLVSAALARAAPPVIQDVCIDRGRATLAPGAGSYQEHVTVRASDADGAGDILCVQISNPMGWTVNLPICLGDGWQEDANTIGCEWWNWSWSAPPPAGPYTVTVWGADGSDSLTSPDAPPVSEVAPEAVLSPTMDSVTHELTPTFQWTASIPGASYYLRVDEEGRPYMLVWRAELGSQDQAVYNFDGTARRPTLDPGRSYFWTVQSSVTVDDHVSDPRVCIRDSQIARGRFTAYQDWPALPELPGNMAYSICTWAWGWHGSYASIMGYNADPETRSWLTRDGSEFCDISPDGSTLLYGLWGVGAVTALLDGSPPTPVPGVSGIDVVWGPDSGRLVYATAGEYNPAFEYGIQHDVWVSAIDGSYQYPIANSYDYDERFPAWSPDGLWIAHRRLYGPTGGVWLVRYDGTDSHRLIGTDVVGYPGYQVFYLDTAYWSPDARQLATTFQARASDGSSVDGIGVISRDGGPVTPVFIAPPGVICCARPKLPEWSPDGTKIVFTSAHQLPPEELPGWREFCPEAELWMINADGTGEPVRLTYDHSYNYSASWWAPNTPPTEPGEEVSVTKGDTTVTFENVTEIGNTSVTVFNEPPGPDPGGFTFLGDYYEISTTAQLGEGSKITLAIHYDDADVPAGQEEWLALLHWENGEWVDITVRPIDTVNNIIRGECTSLSPFGIGLGPQFRGLLPPVNNDNTSIFKLKSTVPIKFQLVAPDGSYVSDATARLNLAKVSDHTVGSYQEAVSTSQADSGNLFRYDATAKQYIFNLGTKGLSTGTWVLQVVVNDLVAKEVRISLK